MRALQDSRKPLKSRAHDDSKWTWEGRGERS